MTPAYEKQRGQIRTHSSQITASAKAALARGELKAACGARYTELLVNSAYYEWFFYHRLHGVTAIEGRLAAGYEFEKRKADARLQFAWPDVRLGPDDAVILCKASNVDWGAARKKQAV